MCKVYRKFYNLRIIIIHTNIKLQKIWYQTFSPIVQHFIRLIRDKSSNGMPGSAEIGWGGGGAIFMARVFRGESPPRENVGG